MRHCRAWDEVVPGLLIGRVLDEHEATEPALSSVTAVLDLTAEFSEAAALRRLDYRNLAVLDLTAPTTAQLAEAVGFVASRLDLGTVYVHCKIGYSRSAAVCGAYLLASGHAGSVDEALARLRAARPSIVIRPEAIAALHAYKAKGTLRF